MKYCYFLYAETNKNFTSNQIITLDHEISTREESRRVTQTDPTDLEILDFLDWVYNADTEKLEAFAALDLSKKLSLWEKLILFFKNLFNGKTT